MMNECLKHKFVMIDVTNMQKKLIIVKMNMTEVAHFLKYVIAMLICIHDDLI